MNVKQIVEQWLRANNFDGLCTIDCGCEVNDLMPCREYAHDCQAGYKVPCPGGEACYVGGGCDFHISPTKPEGVKDATIRPRKKSD